MSGRERTGPAGLGSMTGRAAGCRTNTHVPNYDTPAWAKGYRSFGRVGGHRWRYRFYTKALTKWNSADKWSPASGWW